MARWMTDLQGQDMETEHAADRIVEAFQGLDLDIERDASAQSESIYLTLTKNDATILVRISDHELPPTYGMTNGWADVELWVNESRPYAAFWARAVETIARSWDGAPGWEPTSAVVDALRWYEDQRAAAQSRRDNEELTRQRDRERAAENQRLLDADNSGHLTGQSRKRRLKKLREQQEEPA